MGTEYKTVQIPKEDFELLKAYCDFHDLKLGKFVGKLIRSNCPQPKNAKGNILRVEK